MNHIKTLAAFAALLLPTWALGQIEQGGKPLHWGEPIQETVVWETFGALDLDQLAEEDRVTATMKDAPWRFGVEHEVDFNLTNAGSWSEEDGLRVWRVGVKAEGATSEQVQHLTAAGVGGALVICSLRHLALDGIENFLGDGNCKDIFFDRPYLNVFAFAGLLVFDL